MGLRSLQNDTRFLTLWAHQASNNQHFIPIVDAAVAKQVNSTDIVC